MSRFNRPERRNRNIGTDKQGHGRDNRLVVPSRSADDLTFFERLGPYSKVRRRIKDRLFEFVVEHTRPGYVHACTVDDLERTLEEIPFDDLADLERIVLRQPKRKQENLSSAWGRLVYGYEFEGTDDPAVIIEAVEPGSKLTWSSSLTPDRQKEVSRLKASGFEFTEGRRTIEATISLAAARASQLYRTLLHELGHYLDYQEKVVQPLKDDKQRLDAIDRATDIPGLDGDHPSWAEWNTLFDRYSAKEDKLLDLYHGRPAQEKEAFANRCADRMEERLGKLGVIPFDRILDAQSLSKDQLLWSDFSTDTNPLAD